MQGSRTGVKPFVLAMRPRVVGRRGVRRVNAGAEGINRRQFFAPDGDSDNGMVAPFLKRHRGAKVDL